MTLHWIVSPDKPPKLQTMQAFFRLVQNKDALRKTQTLDHPPHTPSSIPHTLNPTTHTLHPTADTLHFTPSTPNPQVIAVQAFLTWVGHMKALC